MPLKVLHLITSLERGGAQTMLVNLLRHLDRARVASVVAALIDGGDHAAELAGAGIAVHGLGMRRGMPSLAALLRLRALIRAEEPDVVQSWLYHADLMALAATRLMPRMRLAWNLRCADMALEHYPIGTRAVRRLLAWTSRWPDAVLVNSEAGRRYHAALGYRPRRWEVVPNGFDAERFRPDAGHRAEWRQRLGLDATQPVIGMIARVDPMKDHATFLAAAAAIAQARGDARFVLVGAGTEALALPPALAFRLSALGERDDVHEILPLLDLMVLASHGEGFPNVVGEAMASGVACVASDVGDAGAIIADTGAVVPPRDPAALARSVLAILAAGGCQRLGAAARARIVANYAIEAVALRYQRLYADIAG